jgi:hypothetical protein
MTRGEINWQDLKQMGAVGREGRKSFQQGFGPIETQGGAMPRLHEPLSRLEERDARRDILLVFWNQRPRSVRRACSH